jgi:hypothetical protein
MDRRDEKREVKPPTPITIQEWLKLSEKKRFHSQVNQESITLEIWDKMDVLERMMVQGCFDRNEPLRPELKKYLDMSGPFPMFRHPFFTNTPSSFPLCNFWVRIKEAIAQEYRKNGEVAKVLMLYDGPFLIDGFRKEAKKLDDEQYWKGLAYVYTEQEQLWPLRRVLLTFFNSPRPKREALMDSKERKVWEGLPQKVPIWRGFRGDRGKGISWSVKREKAVWFANRFAKELPDLGALTLASGVVDKKDILAYFAGRGEAEVVVDPDRVKSYKVEKLTPKARKAKG